MNGRKTHAWLISLKESIKIEKEKKIKHFLLVKCIHEFGF